MTRPILTLLLATTFGLACASELAAQAPTQETIVADGDFSDWEQVVTNPLNSSRDADGHSVGCAFSTDRDCIVAGSEVDLGRFAWTWSGTDFAFYLDHLATGVLHARVVRACGDRKYKGGCDQRRPVGMLVVHGVLPVSEA